MSEKKPLVLVAGATGRLGTLVVRELLARGFCVRALIVRPFDSPESSGLAGLAIELVEGDLDSVESLARAMDNVDYLISAIGSTKIFNNREFEKIDVNANRNLAEAAKARGLQQMVVVSSVGAGESKEAMGCIYRVLMGHVIKAKTRLEEAVKAAGVNYTIIRPGGYTKQALSGETAIGEGGKIGGLVRREQVATVCVDAISKPEMNNRIFEVVDLAKVKPERRQFVIDI